MVNFFSVLLIPQEDDEVYLSNIIKKLGKEYHAPIFIPHLTLFGGITIDFDRLKSIIDNVFQNVKSFTIEKTGINQTEAFFKTVFIEFKRDENLSELFKTFSQKTDGRDLSTFKPHISLMYKILPEDEKSKIISKLDIKNEFTIGSVCVVAPKEGDKDFYDVDGWRIIYKKNFIPS
ncbi:MAG: 2'-5' RNA ligase family protein [Candidatus Levyibacteriota bacterium]|jgi:2'-5' RNA ligase